MLNIFGAHDVERCTMKIVTIVDVTYTRNLISDRMIIIIFGDTADVIL